jgi:cysteine synthase
LLIQRGSLVRLPSPRIERVGSLLVVRDDLIPGGTKRRVLPGLLESGVEYVYPSPAYGYAQIALAYACRDVGSTATIFTAKRSTMHPRTMEAWKAGARIVKVANGYLSNVKAKAKAYCEATGATLMPFGFDDARFRDALAGIARSLDVNPTEVWTAAGSGTLSRALQAAWPSARFFAVQVGMEPTIGKAKHLKAPERFEDDAKIKPPFPSCSNYDAKVWRFMGHASPGALFWNVAA